MGNKNTPILTEEEPHIFAAWDRERGREKLERKERNKVKIVNLLRWIALIPITLLGSSIIIYILRFTILPQLILGQSTADTMIPIFFNIMVTYVQIEIAHYIAPSHKKTVAMIIFGLTVAGFILSLLVIFMEAQLAENIWSGIGYFFNESYVEFLKPLVAGYSVYQHGYFEKQTKREN